MSPTIKVSPETYRLLECQAKTEGHTIDQMAESLLKHDLMTRDVSLVGSQRVWQDTVDQLLHQILGLTEDESMDLSTIPSACEVREELSRYIPHGHKLSDEIIAMRDEE